MYSSNKTDEHKTNKKNPYLLYTLRINEIWKMWF